jgi:diguanylate cyclase (GGDEF)-like protein/PAS domain S-box-containing protein
VGELRMSKKRNVKWLSKYLDLLPFFQLIENSRDVIYSFEINPKMKFRYISPSLDNFLGKGAIAEAKINPNAPFERIHPDDFDILWKKVNGEMDFDKIIIQRWKDNNGDYRWFEEYASPVFKNGVFIGVQGIMRNIDEKVELQNELQYRISHDVLTDIYNRGFFEHKMDEFNERRSAPVAIVLCDLDGLKYVNDHYGHKEGDKLIQETAKLLNKFSSDSVIVSRIGGDEFVLIVTEKTESQIKQLVTDIQREIGNRNANCLRIPVRMSLGYSYAPCSKGRMEELFSQADKNMYIDKMNRKSC